MNNRSEIIKRFKDKDSVLDNLVVSIFENVFSKNPKNVNFIKIIHAIKNCSNLEKNIIQAAIEHGDLSKLSAIQEIIKSTDANKYTYNLAKEAANKAVAAINDIPNSKYKRALVSIAISSVDRLT